MSNDSVARARRGFRGLLLLAAVACAAPLPALAQRTPPPVAAPSAPSEPLTEDQQKAQQHFQRAKDLYQQGAYREAAGELEIARALDPKAKDLVFNLGVVNERLGKFDEAIVAFQKFLEMDGVTAAERARTESIIKRIEGAKRELPTTPTASASTAPTSKPPEEDGKPPQKGRIDALTIGAAAVGVVGLGVGIGFGIRAVTSQPSDFVTGRDGTYPDLQAKQESAHTSAVVADVGFAVGILGAGAAAYLYFSRTKDPAKARPSTGSKPATVSVAPGPGAVVLHGTFP